MAEIVLDGLELRSLEEVHDRFAAVLPAWYGRNLDALFDCLTDPGEPVTVRLLHREALENRLGPRGREEAGCSGAPALAEEAEN